MRCFLLTLCDYKVVQSTFTYFVINFWPLCTTKNAKFAIFGARGLKFSLQASYLLCMKIKCFNQLFHIFWSDFWPLCTTKYVKILARCFLLILYENKVAKSTFSYILICFWPLCITKNANFAFFGARELKNLTRCFLLTLYENNVV